VISKTWTSLLVLLAVIQPTSAQTVPTSNPQPVGLPPSVTASVTDGTAPAGNWRAPDVNKQRESSPPSSPAATLDAQRVQAATPAVPVRSGGKDMLPNDQGQVWQQYDISAYTSQVKGTEQPEQAIVEWILRETGTEVWFKQPLGLLNATNTTLSVYHTPEMQQIVASVIGRFVNGTQDPHVLGLRVVAVDSPNWRSSVISRLRPISVQSTGIDAWLMSKEDAALLLAELRRRTDFREQSAPNLVYYNGQSQSVSNLRPRVYVKSYRTRMENNTWMGYDVERGQLQEGFSLQVSPLLSQDERTIDAVIKCTVDQVEKFLNVPVDLPGLNGQVQRADIQVPQMVSWRLHERFRWPSNQVLLLSCGVIASTGPNRQTTLGIPNPFAQGGGRSDALLFIESLGKASQALLTGSVNAAGGEAVQPGARY
jgi:hypothetical protein